MYIIIIPLTNDVIPVRFEPSRAGRAPVSLADGIVALPFITVVPSTLNPASALSTPGV